MKRKEISKRDISPSNGLFKKDSDLSSVVSHVFGNNSMKTIFSSDYYGGELKEKEILQNANVWISKVLDEIQPSVSIYNEDKRPGRLGNPQVRFDSTVQMGTMIMSPDRLLAQARSNFSSVKANVCCFSGKWQYELQLESKGVMQLGWSMNEDQFTLENGVGDTIFSYAYDGNRTRKWNLLTSEYGEAWQSGDIIGCTIDLDIGSIHFYRNGRDLGEAFSSIPLGPGCVYFAAISLAFEEKVLANFGSSPFKFPIEPYLPLQQPLTGCVLRINQLLHWLSRVSSLPREHSIKGKSPVNLKQSSEATKLLLCEMLVQHMSEFLNQPYIIDACLVPFLHDSITTDLDKKSLPSRKSLEKVNFLLDSLSLLLEPDDFKEIINAICKCLYHKFQQTSVSLDYDVQKYSLAVLSDICENTSVRKVLLKQPGFMKSRVCHFMDIKPIDTHGLKECVPQPWWESEEPVKEKSVESQTRKQRYLADCKNIKKKTLELERIQEDILVKLLNNNDGTTTEASSRKYFLHLFRQFLKDNHTSGMVFSNMESMTPLPIALSFFHRLVCVIRYLWEKECPLQPTAVPISMFYSGAVNYFSIDRLGGLLSHLVSTQRTALVEALGEDHSLFTEPEPSTSAPPTVQIQVREMDLGTGIMSSLVRRFNIPYIHQSSNTPGVESVTPGLLSSTDSLTELLDGVIMLYNEAAHKQLHKISKLRDDMDKYIEGLNDAKVKQRLAEDNSPESVAQIQNSIQAFEKKLEEQSRVFMAWVRGAIYTSEKRDNLVWLLEATLLSLETASKEGDKFGFVPEYYLDTIFEICSALRNFFNPTLPLEELPDHGSMLVKVAEFLTSHFFDARIVNPRSKDIMTEAIASFIVKKKTLECLENISVPSQERFVQILLRPYDTQTWGQNNWILMRIWQGNGFAFRYKKSPHLSHKFVPSTPTKESGLLMHDVFEPCPSTHYQQLVCRTLSQNEKMASEFLNSVLKQLNWTFSEFISMLQEIQNVSKRPERVIIEARQLKMCATCFDLVIALLRVVEMVCSLCSHIFTENLLERLTQLLGQILLRVTLPKGSFSQISSMELPDLHTIDHFPVLAAVTGVLITLFDEDLSQTGNTRIANMSTYARCFLSEPSFNIESLKFLLGESESSDHKNEKPFSFENYPEAVTVAEVEAVRQMISVLAKYKASMSMSRDFDEEELCPICYAMPLTVTFLPCQHQSCKSCITHHLMDCKNCFFCKANILSVVSEKGSVLFDFDTNSAPKEDV